MKQRGATLLFSLVAATGGGIGLGHWLESSAFKQHTTPPTSAIAVATQPPSPNGLTPPPISPMRASLRKEMELTQARGCSDVDGELDLLEARARKQGKVTAFEVEPGIAILRRCADAETVGVFSQRMLRLQAELGGPAAPSPPPDRLEVRKQLDQLSDQIQHSKDEPQKQAIIRRYLALTRYLGPQDGAEAAMELNRLAAPTRSPPARTAADTLWNAIEHETDESKRQVLIRNYIELVPQLPESERQVRMATLTRRFGTAATP